MFEDFNIQINDGSNIISDLAVKENTKYLSLHDWQINSIKFFFDNNCQAIFEVATGSGKTFCAIEILKKVLEKEPNINTLIVVPKNIILESGWYKELYDAGMKLQDIGVYYGNIKEYAKITITNMQNFKNINFELFDFVIFDECHNYGTVNNLKYLKIPMKYKLGLSATMERMDGTHWKMLEYFDYNVFKYTPKEALQDGVLNPFNFINIGIEMDAESYQKYDLLTQELNSILQSGGGFKKLMRSNSGLKYKMLSKMSERKNLVNNYHRKFEVVKQICNKHENDKIIVFNEYNEQTTKTYWYLLDLGTKACIVHSDIEKSKREKNIMGFKNDKYNVMLASKVLDEGWNLPKLDVAIIAAGNSTARQTIQRMGRVLRKKKKESMLYQIYCKNTIEEEYANTRAEIFIDLSSRYDDNVFLIKDKTLNFKF